MSNLAHLHVLVPKDDMEKLKKFALHRGDLSFLVWQAIKMYTSKLEERREEEDRVLTRLEV